MFVFLEYIVPKVSVLLVLVFVLIEIFDYTHYTDSVGCRLAYLSFLYTVNDNMGKIPVFLKVILHNYQISS